MNNSLVPLQQNNIPLVRPEGADASPPPYRTVRSPELGPLQRAWHKIKHVVESGDQATMRRATKSRERLAVKIDGLFDAYCRSVGGQLVAMWTFVAECQRPDAAAAGRSSDDIARSAGIRYAHRAPLHHVEQLVEALRPNGRIALLPEAIACREEMVRVLMIRKADVQAGSA